MYELAIKPSLDKKLGKIAKKDPQRFEAIVKKAEEIVGNPHHYKNLRSPLQHLKRVHIDASFVLTFSVDENAKKVILEDIDHHDNIYR
jgi:YafQ family addiction module toxin component